MKNYHKTIVIQFILLTFTYVSVLSPAYSGIVSSDELLSEFQADEVRSDLTALFDREDVQKELIKQGVDPALAKSRISSMTDSEVAMLNKKMEKLPAAQGAVEVIALVFIIVLLLEILGITDVSDKV